MKTPIALIALIALFPLSLQAVEASNESHKEGEYLGAISAEIPQWFKESFLDFAEDVAEASAENKRVMLYFHQPSCPYCAKLVNENFKDAGIKKYIQKHFDGIAINMWGDREIIGVGNKTFTEKQFALALKVQYTPTVLFLNEQGKTILRLNGYYPPKKFRAALRYAGEHLETQQTFNAYLKASSKVVAQNKIHAEDFFIASLDLKKLSQTSNNVSAVFFEKNDCEDCIIVHEKVLGDKTTRDIVKRFNNIQLDALSDEQIITPEGKAISISKWANELNIAYYPSVVFFDVKGVEVMRIAGFIKSFHFQSVYDYVFEKAYLTEPSFQRYISDRGEKIRALGFNTDIWGYHSEYSLKEISE